MDGMSFESLRELRSGIMQESSAIYKLIPSFRLKESGLYKQRGKKD